MRKGREYMPLSDGLMTTGAPRSKASTTAAKKLLGTSSPIEAGAVASLERPRPAGIQVRERQDKGDEWKNGRKTSSLQEALPSQSCCARVLQHAVCLSVFLQHSGFCHIRGKQEAGPSCPCPSPTAGQRPGENQALKSDTAEAKSEFSIYTQWDLGEVSLARLPAQFPCLLKAGDRSICHLRLL